MTTKPKTERTAGTLKPKEQPTTPALCSDCGAPMSGQHFDDCVAEFGDAAQPKGPRR